MASDMLLQVFLLAFTAVALTSAERIELQRHFEFENALNDLQQNQWVWRSEASNQKTLRIVDPVGQKSVEIRICIEPVETSENVTFYVDDIRYSNDGPSDRVTLTFNGAFLAMFETVARWRSGHEWNVFRNSGQLGGGLMLTKGEYWLTLQMTTDNWGLELDRIRVNLENQNPRKTVFCGASFVG